MPVREACEVARHHRSQDDKRHDGPRIAGDGQTDASGGACGLGVPLCGLPRTEMLLNLPTVLTWHAVCLEVRASADPSWKARSRTGRGMWAQG
jgi:hypothetical protein